VMQDVTAEELRGKWNYDPDTGLFTKKYAERGWPAGHPIGAVHPDGYVVTSIRNRQYSVHRLVWLYVHGEWPEHDVEHRDRNRANNRIANLRPCNDSQNQANQSLSMRNASGRKGVTWLAKHKKWQASIKVRGKSRYLGVFDNLDEAGAAYQCAAIEVHGEYAAVLDDDA